MKTTEIETQRSRPLLAAAVDRLYKGLVVLQTVLLGLLLVIVAAQIAARLIPFLPYMLWTEEIARFLLVWVIFLGASIGVKESSHFTVSLLPEARNRLVALGMELAILLGIVAFAAIFIVRGGKYARVMYWDISDVAQISMLWVGIAIPVFGILSTLFLIEKIIEALKKGETA